MPLDKQLHFTAGVIAYTATNEITHNPLMWVFLIGAGKEIYDSTQSNHTAEFMDFIATLIGGLIAKEVIDFATDG